MENVRNLRMVDGSGRPFDARVESALSRMLPRLRREFPSIQDEVVLWQILEEAGRRIVHRESNRGPIEKINGYAWVTIRSVANSMLRQRSGQTLQRTLASEASGGTLARTTATDGCKEQIEQNILIRELLAPLTPDEQQMVPWKFFGFSSREIARRRGCTVNAVNLTFFHAKEKIRRSLGVQHAEAKLTARADQHRVRDAGPHTFQRLSELPDGKTKPTS
jgi:DNA-directed RNA polymerase specialized sigma24 family protein